MDDHVHAVRQALGDLGGRVPVGDVELDRLGVQARGHLAQILGQGGHVQQDELGPVAVQGRGDRLADAPRGARDERCLALKGTLPVELGRLGHGLPHADDLAGDVGRARGEQEAQGGLDLLLGTLGDVDELDGDAPADLLAQRAGEALERPLRGGLSYGLLLWRRAQHDHPAGGLRAFDVDMEEALELDQLGGVGDAGGVEHECLDRLLALGGPRCAGVLQQALQLSPQPPAGRSSEQRRTGDGRHAGRVALQLDG